jgi:hypothetical protein
MCIIDENELDIPNGESNVENEDEEQNEVEEQEYYVEGWYNFFNLAITFLCAQHK